MEYEEMYSLVDINKLNEKPLDNNSIEHLFDVADVYNKQPHKNCISVSLFCQHVDNTYVNEYGEKNDWLNINTNWYKKYYISFMNFIKEYNNSHYFDKWKIRIYLENKMGGIINKLLIQSPHIEIYHMKHNSIGAQPGMLWRFMAFNDNTLDTAFSCDIDDTLHTYMPYIDSFYNSNKTFGRYLSYYGDNFNIDKTDNNSPLNYAVVLGSRIGFRPKNTELNIVNIIINYILHRISRYSSCNPHEEFDNVNTERFNKPIRNHIYGWGGLWTMYGFDEKFWKHTLFPYFVKRGEVMTWDPHNTEEKINIINNYNPVIIDYNFIKKYNNNLSRV